MGRVVKNNLKRTRFNYFSKATKTSSFQKYSTMKVKLVKVQMFVTLMYKNLIV